MRQFFLVILSILFITTAQAQTIEQVDSAGQEFCKWLESEVDNLDDESLLEQLYGIKFKGYIMQVEEKNRENVVNQLFYRMQRNCATMRAILNRVDPPVSGKVNLKEQPESKLTPEQIAEFKATNRFSYLEANGDKTIVDMKKGKWTDRFVDKTTSQLTYEWMTEVDFKLIFIKSNNITRKNMSVEGDEYIYRIAERIDDYYLMYVSIPGQNDFQEFKLFIEK